MQTAVAEREFDMVDTVPEREPDPFAVHRNERIAWKMRHWPAWRAHLEALPHHDAGYDYDIAHEYEEDWTSDPDYGDDIRRIPHTLHGDLDTQCVQDHICLQDAGHRLVAKSPAGASGRLATLLERRLAFAGVDWWPTANRQVRPDLAVLDLDRLPDGRDEDDARRHIRMDKDDPAPLLIMEITSPNSTRDRDWHLKKHLYAELGVQEYLIVDAKHEGAPYRLNAFWLEKGGYSEVILDEGADGIPHYFCEALECHIRLQPDPDPESTPRMQWLDKDAGRWRDLETDLDHARHEATEARHEATEAKRKAAEAATVFLNAFQVGMDADALREVGNFWRTHGPPEPARLPYLLAAVTDGHSPWQSLQTAVMEDADGVPDPARIRRILVSDVPAAVHSFDDHWGCGEVPHNAPRRVLDALANPKDWPSALGLPAQPEDATEHSYEYTGLG